MPTAIYHLTNHAETGMLDFRFRGIVLTDPEDRRTRGSDLEVELVRETCAWLTEPVVQWFAETVAAPWKSNSIDISRPVTWHARSSGSSRSRPASDDQDGFLGMFSIVTWLAG